VEHRIRRLCYWILLWAFAGLFIEGCGSGGGGGGVASPGAAPYIFASVISFQSGAVPPGFIKNGSNTLVEVEVQDDSSGVSLTDASVSINGVQLAYNPALQEYTGEIVVSPTGAVTLSVTARGATYTASARQFASYPTISTPLTGATWSSLYANLVAWSSVVPTTATDSIYAIGVLDENGELVWPSGQLIQVLPATANSFSIDSNGITDGNRFVIAGVAGFSEIPSAAPDSSMVIGGFSEVPITVTSVPTTPTVTLISIAVTPGTPTVSVAGTRQLTATGTYSDSSTQDVTAQVTWLSSDTAKATVSSTGLVTGVASGSATITASVNSVSGTATISVFQPHPSPVPPLSQSVTYQIDYAHSGFASFGAPLSFPATPTWSVTLGGAISYPLIAGGRVFVTTSDLGASGSGPGKMLYALDKQNGNIVWGPVAISGTYLWSGHAYDHGKIFVVNVDGLLQSFDAVTGKPGWSKQLPNQYFFTAPPTAVNGLVYVGGAGTGGTLYAVDESDGNVVWTAGVANGDRSSPTVSSDGVFVSYPCQVTKFNPFTGLSLWQYSGGCSGGGGKTAAYANGLLYVRDSNDRQVFDAATGNQVGTFASSTIPAFSAETGFFQNAGTLRGIDLGTHNVQWSFTGDGMLVSAPIVIDGRVIVGSSSGNVYAVDAVTGAQTWSGYAGAPIAPPDEQNVIQPLTGFAAGEGYLIVPASGTLTAWQLSGP
jgi:outer membrane protein assembly factor BamB